MKENMFKQFEFSEELKNSRRNTIFFVMLSCFV